MKFLFYINAIHHGGAERVMTNLATRFSVQNECVLVTSYIDEWEYPYGERVKRINLLNDECKGFLIKNIRLVRSLKKLIKEEKPDIAVSFMAEPNFRLLLANKGKKTKTIISVRNDPEKEYPNKLFKFLARNLYKKADGIVFQTSDARKWFPKKIQDKSTIIFNQVDEKFFNVEKVEKREGIFSVGRLTSQKNHKLLIDAFNLIKYKTKENVYIYGEGELKEELLQYIKDRGLEERVFLCGTTKDVPNTIKSARVFVLSSDYEGMPNALMEAMALNLVCVSTDCPCGGPKMLIDDGVNGFLTEVNNKEMLAEQLLKALNADASVGENARKKAEEFKPDIVYKQWEDYFTNL